MGISRLFMDELSLRTSLEEQGANAQGSVNLSD